MKRRRSSSSQFGAPWSRGVKFATSAAGLLLVGLSVILPLTIPRAAIWAAFLGPGIMLVTFSLVALFCVRGYTLRHRELLIQRSFWQTRLSLKELQRAYVEPAAMKKTIRSCGNGGFMAYTGWFYNKRLGHYRAFVTDPARSVVLEFAKRKVVVSPDDPDAFVRTLGFDPDAKESAA
ncbi:MAG: hypothetical protein KIS67_09565 [Verrucomicrobiae bacterium]|nr:hypothetical protein [Verrucomicrobiae bacterium]